MNRSVKQSALFFRSRYQSCSMSLRYPKSLPGSYIFLFVDEILSSAPPRTRDNPSKQLGRGLDVLVRPHVVRYSLRLLSGSDVQECASLTRSPNCVALSAVDTTVFLAMLLLDLADYVAVVRSAPVSASTLPVALSSEIWQGDHRCCFPVAPT
jgi:hypothetical protein